MSRKIKTPIVIKDKVKVVVKYHDGHTEIHVGKGDSVTNDGLNWLIERIDSDAVNKMAYGAIGTGTNTPQASDTELQTEKLRKTFSVSTNPSTGVKHWEFVIDFSELNGETLSEVGVLNEAEEGTLLLRKLLDPVVEKTSDKKATVIVEVMFAQA